MDQNPSVCRSALKSNVAIANAIAFIFGILTFVLLVVLEVFFRYTVGSPILFGLSLFYFLTIFLNKKGFVNTGRIMLCAIPVIVALGAALLSGLYYARADVLYYDGRFILAGLSIVPCLVFSIQERAKLFGCLGLILLCILLFDPLHEWLGVGYHQMGFVAGFYDYISYAIVIIFFGITGGAILLKKTIENLDQINQEIKTDFESSSRQLQVQHEIIMTRHERLSDRQQRLLDMIEKQKSELRLQVALTNSNLEETKEEMLRHGQELWQFAYSISNDSRVVVAQLLAVIQELESQGEQKPFKEMIGYVKNVIQDIDNSVKDLNKIVDIKTSLCESKERIDFAHEWEELKSILNISAAMEAEIFVVDFSGAPHLYSIKQLVKSILFNLVSNSIRYRSSQRPLHIFLRTSVRGPYTVIEVCDNGMSMELDEFGDDAFKTHQYVGKHEDNGTRLQLVRSQAELLDGFVDVKNQPEGGVRFKVGIRTPVPVLLTEQSCINLN